ncbi:MAG: hypothetical protein ABH828_03970 [archaeon]
MAKHNHDVHYLFITMILGFFVFAMTMTHFEPSVTANVVQTDSDYSIIDFFKAASRSNEFVVDPSPILKPIEFNIVGNPWKEALIPPTINIGGAATANPVLLGNLNCEWINLDNGLYDKLKTLTGYSACEVSGYSSCLMTNTLKTVNYYKSVDGTCSNLQFKDESNHFNNCDEIVRNAATLCETDSTDNIETQFTTVFCCN